MSPAASPSRGVVWPPRPRRPPLASGDADVAAAILPPLGDADLADDARRHRVLLHGLRRLHLLR
jgi:hypothetical protein